MGLPRVDVVFRLWQCDKENHGRREGRPGPSLASFDLVTGLHSPGKVSSEQKENNAFYRFGASRPYSQYWPVNSGHSETGSQTAMITVTLLVTQRQHGLDRGCTASGKPTCHKRYHKEDGGDRHEGDRIVGVPPLDVVCNYAAERHTGH
jgi:hypothetical protein